jgi:hypothetical protein
MIARIVNRVVDFKAWKVVEGVVDFISISAWSWRGSGPCEISG